MLLLLFSTPIASCDAQLPVAVVKTKRSIWEGGQRADLAGGGINNLTRLAVGSDFKKVRRLIVDGTYAYDS